MIFKQLAPIRGTTTHLMKSISRHSSLWMIALLLAASLITSCKNSVEESMPGAETAKLSAHSNARISPSNSTIYLVQKGVLYGVNASNFEDFTKLGGNWYGTSSGIADDGSSIYAIQSGKLWQTNRFTGEFKVFGNGNWLGAVGVTGVAGFADEQGNMFIQKDDHLWIVDLFGKHRQLGQGGWAGTKAIFYHRGFLYVIWKNGFLYKVNSKDGSWKELSGGWGDVKGIAAPNSTGDLIYIIEGKNLWEVNVNTNLYPVGKNRYLRNGFNNTTAMAGVSGHLFIASDGGLHKVDLTGKKIMTNLHYDGITSMGAAQGLLN
ncbi:hypothetical protein [Dyadobacter fermentans]|uniref:hypothetical protein n=1 Tax=Dyadobacter fermentans TaxID=94254 RepID=UPI001CBB1477|nr:hypothetical protein [Dyadobacter fermentans]MBZ1357186.1 hypothetical protein [Dyadobacter fermentans]